MRGSGRGSGRGGGTKRKARRKLPPVVCPDKCSWGIAAKQDSVSPQDLHMSESDIAAARLRGNGQLFNCRHCGCVWEKYRDPNYDDWFVRRIGKYDGPGPELGFVLDRRLKSMNRLQPRTSNGATGRIGEDGI